MKRRINTNLYNLETLLSDFEYYQILEKISNYEAVLAELATNKSLLMFNFEDNDVEVMQAIDTVELQQYYVSKNIEILELALSIMERDYFIHSKAKGIKINIGLN